jgi:hypothetical protein
VDPCSPTRATVRAHPQHASQPTSLCGEAAPDGVEARCGTVPLKPRKAWFPDGLDCGNMRAGMFLRWGVQSLRFAAVMLWFLVVLEVCARLDDLVTWGAPLWGEYSQNRLRLVDQLGPRCRPCGRFEKWQLNSHGFRGPELSMTKPAGVTRILLVGASETFGLQESPGNEYPAQLGRRLDQARPGRFEVINAACAGMSPPRIDQLLQAWLGQFKPDLVAFYPSPQFYLDDEPPARAHTTTPTKERWFVPRLERRAKTWLRSLLPSHLQTWARQASIEWYARRHGPNWLWREVPEDRVQAFRDDLRTLVQTTRSLGARPVLLTHAHRFGATLTPLDREQLVALRKFYPRAATSLLVPFEQAMNRALLDTAQQMGVAAIDVEQRLGKNPELFADFSHFTDQGAQAMAELLSDELLRLVPPPQTPRHGMDRP